MKMSVFQKNIQLFDIFEFKYSWGFGFKLLIWAFNSNNATTIRWLIRCRYIDNER